MILTSATAGANLQPAGARPAAAATSSAATREPNPDEDEDEAEADEMELVKRASRAFRWTWNEADQSTECLLSPDRATVCFHPDCSESAAACRGSRPLARNGNYYYWELLVLEKCYGTSVMFGLCTRDQQLHVRDYCNLVGLDPNGWSLSHKGLVWHNGQQRRYTDPFPANQPVKLGLMYNTLRGELSYYMGGRCLGVAFGNLNSLPQEQEGAAGQAPELYPVVGSTAKCTRIQLLGAYCGYVSLLERACFTLVQSARDRRQLVAHLRGQRRLPSHLVEYLARAANAEGQENGGE